MNISEATFLYPLKCKIPLQLVEWLGDPGDFLLCVLDHIIHLHLVQLTTQVIF